LLWLCGEEATPTVMADFDISPVDQLIVKLTVRVININV